MSDVSIGYRKIMVNPLLKRKQMIVDVKHPGKANVSKKDLRAQIAKEFHVKETKCLQLFGFRTDFGGQKSSGFCLIYDTLESLQKYEPKYRLLREGMGEKAITSAKARKEKKNKMKKLRAKAKRQAMA